MNIIINSDASISIDGHLYGAFIDALNNNPKIASSIQSALAAYISNIEKEKSNSELKFTLLQKQVKDGISAIHDAVLDPQTPTDEAVLAIIAEATKDERERRSDEIDQQIATLQKEKGELTTA